MDAFLNNVFLVLQITVIDIVLSGDNMGVIALAVRKLPKKQARAANFIGVLGAILMRIIFASVVTTLLLIEWLPVKLAGGLLLLKITYNLINIKKDSNTRSGSRNGFWKAIYNIIMADMSVSLDNVLAVGGIARGNIILIVFGLLLNIPVIFFGSQIVSRLIEKYRISVFIGAGVLVHTGLEMMLEDKMISSYIPPMINHIFPWTVALIIFIYGIYWCRKGDLKST